ncbi:MAG TPA: 3-hydroxyacyl-CoA dehydrogenase NAD-binding domain-containing protein [Xanthobacteraceae bacterium]|jgi:3-hydroxyacyl-CoA dehydrogenase|nr:3-hydroxyacyl-CoA dehydrogenase NAD-binding domain-containing protein [Xanthobacteraceae bacterium]
MRTDGDVAVITIDNPPVNAMKHEVRVSLLDLVVRAAGDPAISAVVIACAGRTFVAGADITEFGQPPRQPTAIAIIEAIEASPKPVVAALHGTPLGGGLELALGCHFRVAAPGTRPGLPEIKLGIIPGAGGTQRLPRLVGMDKAMAMILTGEPISAREALDSGLVDEIVEGDLVAGAIAFARRIVAGKRPLGLVRNRDEKLVSVRDIAAFDAAAANYTRRAKGQNAPAAAIAALRGAITLPVADALKRERDLFLELVAGDQSKAQRHIFFAEREAAKVPDLAGVKAHDIRKAAVIGAGTMGGGIAMCFANAGIPVTVVESDDEALARGLDTVARNYRNTAARGGLAADEMEARIRRITGTTDLAAVADADIVIEAVFEEMDVKQEVFGRLDRIVKGGAVIASNTSYLDIDVLARSTARPQAVLGMHFFSPANVMRLLEVVRGAATSPETLATAIAVGRKLGKVPAVVGVCHGFVGNRMLRLRSIEAERLLLEGALPQDVDAALTDFGFPMGPFAMADLAGLDVGWRMRKAQGLTAPIADELCERGRYGQKTGRGFYLYDRGSRTPQPDPEVERLIVDAAARRGLARRALGKDEMVERLLFPMINEGARILREGIAQRPGDIDVIWVYGYGFPVYRGGPMHYADSVGLRYIRDRLAAFAETTGDERHRPAPLLEELAAAGKGFASLRG